MTGQSGLDGDLRRFVVPDLPHHDDVGILAQEGAERRGEVEADLLVDLDLVDPRQVVLHRILGRGDVLRGLVQLRQGTI